jgi:hypothetical protein
MVASVLVADAGAINKETVMKNLANYMKPASLLICLSITLCISKANADNLDVNLGGNANLNINNANNNKLTTPLKNFAPVDVEPKQIDLTPLATPPATGTVQRIVGGKEIIEVVDKDVKNEKEAKDLQRQTGDYVGTKLETPNDGEPLKDSDITDFLKNYYSYLKDKGLSSATAPIVPISPKPATKKTTAPSGTTSLNNGPKELLATPKKLLTSNASTQIKDQIPSSH